MAPLRRGFIFFVFFLWLAIAIAARRPSAFRALPVLHSLRSYYNHIPTPLAKKVTRQKVIGVSLTFTRLATGVTVKP